MEKKRQGIRSMSEETQPASVTDQAWMRRRKGRLATMPTLNAQ
jgi:hypothetical protein